MPIDPPSNPQPPDTFLEPVRLFGGIYLAASLAGLSALLRSKQPLTVRAVVSAMLNSGFIGTIIGLVWYMQYRDTNLFFLVGVSVLAGLGGGATIEFAFQLVRAKFGLPRSSSSDNSEPPTNKP